MIYIILDRSYKCDSHDRPSNLIKYASTSKEGAISIFNTYYSEQPKDDKWHREYQLLECVDGYSIFSAGLPKVLLTSKNEEQ